MARAPLKNRTGRQHTDVLNPQQLVFAQGVAKHGNLSLAAKEAGYSYPDRVGSRHYKNPRIRAEVDRLRKLLERRRDKKTVADAEELRAFLTKLVRGYADDQAESDDVPLETRRRAAMDLAKLSGWIVERNEHSGPDGRPIQVEGVEGKSRAELEARARQLLEQGSKS